MITNKLRFVETDEKETIERKKAKLRQYAKERRGENENRDVKEKLLTENALSVIEKAEKREKPLSVFIYCSYSSEAPTDDLIERLKEKGYTVYTPRVEGREMVAVLHEEEFTLSEKGIREPVGAAYEGAPDVIVLPLLAVDEQGNRLGYGGGYYDRYLKKYPNSVRIAYGFDFQVIHSVPHTKEDELVDVIVTDKRTLFIKNNRKNKVFGEQKLWEK